MASGVDLRVKISADLADIKQGLGLVRSEIAKVKQQSAQAAPGASWMGGLRAIRTQIAGVVSAYAALRAVRTYADLSDQASKLTGRLKLATKGQDEFTKAYKGTLQIAQQSQADWQSIVGLFSSLSQTTGQSQDRILNLTKIIGQAFRVSGAGAQDTSRGIQQLQQAMAGGVLRAEEFNTIIETSPRIVQALADHFGISFGQVRKYVVDGKVTTQEFMVALEKASDSIEADFNKMPKTVGGAVQQVRNALVAMVGDTNTATGASNDLAEGISDLADTLGSSQVKQGFQSLVQGISSAVGWMAKLLTTTADVTRFIGEELAARMNGPALGDTVRIEQKIERLKKQYTSGGGIFGDAPDPISKLLGIKQTSGNSERYAEIQRLEQMLKLSKELEAAGAKASEAPAKPASPAGGGGGGGKGKADKAVAESNALMRDSVDRALTELERLYKASEVGVQEYFAARTTLQQQAIDLDIEQARNELAVTKDKGQRLKLEEQILILQRDRADVAARNAQEEQKASEDMIDKLGEVQAKLAELDGNTAKAARIRIYAEFHELFKALEANSDATGKKMVQNLVDRLVNKAQADAIASRVSAITSNLSAQEGSISAQMDAGTLGMAEGERRLQAIRQKALDQLREQRDLQAAVLRGMSVDSPDFAAAEAGLAAIDANIANTTASMNKFQQGVEDVAVSSLTGFFDDLIDGTKSFKDAFIDMVRSFVAGVAKMIAQELALAAVRAALRAWGGGSANGNVFSGAGKSAFARGGAFDMSGLVAFAKGGAFTNQIVGSPTYFAFGNGGQFGVMGEAGPEAVMPLTRGPGGRLGVDAHGAAGASRKPDKYVLAFGDDEIANAMAGAAGEAVWLLHARNNRETFNGGG